MLNEHDRLLTKASARGLQNCEQDTGQHKGNEVFEENFDGETWSK
jgi:hypothetical protein